MCQPGRELCFFAVRHKCAGAVQNLLFQELGREEFTKPVGKTISHRLDLTTSHRLTSAPRTFFLATLATLAPLGCQVEEGSSRLSYPDTAQMQRETRQ